MHNDYADRKKGASRSATCTRTWSHLGDTQGLMIYQESVMRVAQKFAGYTLEEADNLRKACGKKDRVLIAAEREKFEAAAPPGVRRQAGRELFDIIEPFADYAFNKSHSYGYGLVAYQTAWLKVHHPVEYMAALLTSVKDDKDKTAVYLAECRALGIEVLVPDVNRSAGEFTPRGAAPAAAADEGDPGPGIVFGLAAVRNVGESLVERIVAEREAQGPSPTSTTSADGWTPSCSTSGPWSPWSRPGPSTRWHTPPGPLPGARRSGGPHDGAPPGARRRHRHPVLLVEPAEGAGEPAAGGTRVPIPSASSTSPSAWPSKGDARPLCERSPAPRARGGLSRHTDCSLAELRDAALAAEPGGAAPEGVVRSVGGWSPR